MDFCPYCGFRSDLCRCNSGYNPPNFPPDDHPGHGDDHDHHPKPPPPPPPPAKKKEIIHDNICGNIEQSCGEGPEEYWSAMDLSDLPSASLSVFNKGNCDIIVSAAVNGGGTLGQLFTVARGQTKSITIGNIASLSFECEGNEGDICRGTYCLSLHYEKEC
ncbi:hypothetical protein J7I93_19460 [Bacillus sp. ISL-47]|uniref:DUF3992 domain-containing protein n=1 Tax=Bacillus sp. ISL-47 TaxID=2819130 RepID=UPI001BEAF1EB|nr:S-Ena type endospore appendage [Bacillus sp. ISL-47]MBT2690334.1 hypothetical protein [Bacillus sp. ISL-47]MBT2709218.1 hypothetical protein [Pseudomonas sp. ISL-84]